MTVPIRTRPAVLAVFALCFCLYTSALAKDKPLPVPTQSHGSFVSLDHRIPGDTRPLYAQTANDTFVLGFWDFEYNNPQGWTSVDMTEQTGIYWHVDDFAGLGGGDFGRLLPLQGNQSMWCGTRPAATNPLCSYATLPGYGNNWLQYLQTRCITLDGDGFVDFLIMWDTELDWDYVQLEMKPCDGEYTHHWTRLGGGLGEWDGQGDGFVSSVIHDSLVTDSIRIRFRFYSDGSYSDEDGLWDSDGAVILDSLTVSDATGVVLPTELFETESPGATAAFSGNWTAVIEPGYGDFAALFPGYNVLQEDPCVSNLGSIWGFFSGSTVTYGCGQYPEQLAVPYQNVRHQYTYNEIWSPILPLAGSGSGGGFEVVFDVYRDLPLDALIFFTWSVRSIDAGGCMSRWNHRDTWLNHGPYRKWDRVTEPFGDLVEPGAVAIQVSLGAFDACRYWCGVWGYGVCHTHAPLFDNVEVRRIDTEGPQWTVIEHDLFQDTFAIDGTTTGTARIDPAIDLLPYANPNIRPGDSTVVTVSDPEVGLAGDPYTGYGPAVYAYVSPWGPSEAHPAEAYSDDPVRWPVVDSLSHNGRMWYCVRTDSTKDRWGNILPHTFAFDLNDNLFVPGDTINFIFAAQSAAPSSHWTYWSPFTGTSDDLASVLNEPAECTILPAAPPTFRGNILYVDGYDGRGAQPFFDTAFKAIGVDKEVDRYDIRSPSNAVGNHPGARVSDVVGQLLPRYSLIIWNTGDLDRDFIGDGSTWAGKSDDAGMLLEFLDGLMMSGGLYLSGDNFAWEWAGLSGSAPIVRDTYIQYDFIDEDHVDEGLAHSPLVIGEPGGPFHHIDGPDTTYALSLCPELREFDVIEPEGLSIQLMRYDGGSPALDGAVVGQATTNPQGETVRVVLSGFSFHEIRDDRVAGELDRSHLLQDILTWMDVYTHIDGGAPSRFANRLAQNYPNPFNPATTIEFSLRERGRVALRVYNVRGQLVKTLVNEERSPGISHRVEWDGRNNAGQSVASGVYFYRLVTRGFTKTKKMVLLK